jgi:DNA-binding NarL/FixJ family response regulator
MTSARKGQGGEHLARRSNVAQAKISLPDLNDVLVVEDTKFDEKHLTATLRLVLGLDANIRVAHSLDQAIDAVLQSPPDVMFLDDYLKPNDSAAETIPLVRRAGYNGPIIVVSGDLYRERAIKLKKAGAADCIHKDNIDSVELGEALLRAFADQS